MRTTIIAAAALGLLAGPAAAQGYHSVEGYTRQNGTYVAPHYQTNPDNTRANNWSTQGNTNPFTGQAGTQNPNPGYGSPGSNAGSIYDGGSNPGSIYGGASQRR